MGIISLFLKFPFKKHIYYMFLVGTDLTQFLYTHVTYVHPEFVLGKANISIHSVTQDHVIFAMTRRNVDVYNFAR